METISDKILILADRHAATRSKLRELRQWQILVWNANLFVHHFKQKNKPSLFYFGFVEKANSVCVTFQKYNRGSVCSKVCSKQTKLTDVASLWISSEFVLIRVPDW